MHPDAEAPVPAADPPPDCPLCPRLVAFRHEQRAAAPDWFNAPVPTFGDPNAILLVVGLAPGLKGANRTGRPFTGDYAGDLLYRTLLAHGWARGRYDARPDDGLVLAGAAITNAVRCVPPRNKPTGAETRACRPFLEATIARLADLRAVLALGRLAHDAVLDATATPRRSAPFGHGALHPLPGGLLLADSYHCSRYNTNTGRLTPQMFDACFRALADALGRPGPGG